MYKIHFLNTKCYTCMDKILVAHTYIDTCSCVLEFSYYFSLNCLFTLYVF